MLDSILITPPVSSPLHPQAGLPLLKGYLSGHGYQARIIDTNIQFYNWFLKENPFSMTAAELYENPLKILSCYDEIENRLWEKSRPYKGLSVGMRYVDLIYDRTCFDEVVQAVSDQARNPFVQFYDQVIDAQLLGTGAKIIGIGITFQDQIIAAFTLADLIRKKIPEVKIILGGQMITRCHDTMVRHTRLSRFFDYLVLWDGEEPLLDIHRKEISGETIDFVNVIDMAVKTGLIKRKEKAPPPSEIPSPDFSDLDFSDYFFPEMLVPVQTTRGCYANCEFCAIPFGSNSYRMRPVDRIIDDFIRIQEHTLERYGKKATYFKFMEDTSSPKLLFDMSMEIEKRGLDVKWETFARLEKAFTKQGVMDQLFRGGCRKIHWGLESNDPDILKDMNKKITTSYSDKVLELSSKAGVLNFCFVLLGFPGETDASRTRLADYIIGNRHIHTITLTTFDLTRGAPMQQHFIEDNSYGLQREEAQDFQVRLPYTVHGENWKAEVVEKAHEFMMKIIEKRPDIGFMTLFPDQVRSMFCEQFTNQWGQIFVEKYGENNIREMLLNTKKYIRAYKEKSDIDPGLLPEPLRREHFRTKEDLKMISSAIISRKQYEKRRFDQV